MTQERPLVGLTLGDPSGVGPEIVVRALADHSLRATLRALVVGDAQTVRRAIAGCGLELEVRCVDGPEQVDGASGVVEVLDLNNVGDLTFGVVDPACGQAAVESIEATCRLAREGRIDAIVTAPINKEALRASGSRHPGHTEMLADLLGTPAGAVMTMFVLDRLRIFFLTRHLSRPMRSRSSTSKQLRRGCTARMRSCVSSASPLRGSRSPRSTRTRASTG